MNEVDNEWVGEGEVKVRYEEGEGGKEEVGGMGGCVRMVTECA